MFTWKTIHWKRPGIFNKPKAEHRCAPHDIRGSEVPTLVCHLCLVNRIEELEDRLDELERNPE